MRPLRQPGSPIRTLPTGFTLIEIMVVIGIAALVMAWGVPAVFRAFKKDTLRQAAADIVEGCSHARARAILQGLPMELIIRAEDGSLTVQPKPETPGRNSSDPTAPDFFPAQSQDPPVSMKPYSARLDEHVAVELLDVNFRDHLELPEARVRFYPNGTCDEFTIVLRGDTGGTQKISLDVVTGESTIEVLQ